MFLKLQQTDDGSHTLFSEQFNEIYHSRHGAWQESAHVFVNAGLDYLVGQTQTIHLLEVGFGTGLNALLSLEKIQHHPQVKLHYHGLEPLPVPEELVKELNYSDFIANQSLKDAFFKMHEVKWNAEAEITAQFFLLKDQVKLENFDSSPRFDLVYFDAFAPSKHPDMWQPDKLERVSKAMKTGGILVTYCAKGQFKRDLKHLGLDVESLPGPQGKREMTRAVKL